MVFFYQKRSKIDRKCVKYFVKNRINQGTPSENDENRRNRTKNDEKFIKITFLKSFHIFSKSQKIIKSRSNFDIIFIFEKSDIR